MKNKISLFFFLSALILCLTISLAFSEETLTNLSNRNYFENVHNALREAKKSIIVVMHLVTVNPNNKDSLPYKLLSELIEARNRGLEVKVILEDSIDKNKEAFQILTEAGVDVRFDSSRVYTHSKVIVIDRERVILGSANWTYSGLSSGNESSVMIDSKGFAKRVLKDIESIETKTLAKPLDKNQVLKVPIAREFMYNKHLAGRLMSANDERAFDVYLVLLYFYNGNKEEAVSPVREPVAREAISNGVNVDYERLGRYLNLDTKKEKGYAYKRQIMRALYKLDKRYSFIDSSGLKEKRIVNLLNYKDSTMYYEIPEREYFNIPIAFFEYGWIGKLSLRAKYSLLINLYEMELSPENPVWSASLNYLSEKFNVSASLISMGMRELRKAGLLEVVYSEIDEGYKGRGANKYRLRELFQEAERKEVWDNMNRIYGEKRINEARELAIMLDEGNNPDTVEEFTLLIEEYGLENVRKANRITASKSADNPKRHIRYTVGILKGWKDNR